MGPGRWQLTILDVLAPGVGVALTDADPTHADQNGVRRSASALEATGRTTVISQHDNGVPRLVAYLPDDALSHPSAVLRADRKWYRQPGRSG